MSTSVMPSFQAPTVPTTRAGRPAEPSTATFCVDIGSSDGRCGGRLHAERGLDPPHAVVGHLVLTGRIGHATTASVVHLLDAFVRDVRAPALELTMAEVTAISAVDAHWLLGAASTVRPHGGHLVLTGPVFAEPLRRSIISLNVPTSAQPRCGCVPRGDVFQTAGGWWPARYAGTCVVCHGHFPVGTPIRRADRDHLVAECCTAPQDTVPDPRSTTDAPPDTVLRADRVRWKV